uniref:Uncharacterized protein n=1 Tax=Leersia perrieri TaxID=77586 RepID=A0A0D9Y031_9ORYZ
MIARYADSSTRMDIIATSARRFIDDSND